MEAKYLYSTICLLNRIGKGANETREQFWPQSDGLIYYMRWQVNVLTGFHCWMIYRNIRIILVYSKHLYYQTVFFRKTKIPFQREFGWVRGSDICPNELMPGGNRRHLTPSDCLVYAWICILDCDIKRKTKHAPHHTIKPYADAIVVSTSHLKTNKTYSKINTIILFVCNICTTLNGWQQFYNVEHLNSKRLMQFRYNPPKRIHHQMAHITWFQQNVFVHIRETHFALSLLYTKFGMLCFCHCFIPIGRGC